MEAVTRPRAAEPGVVLALQRGHLLLRGNGAQVEHGVGVFVLTNDLARVDVAHRVERHHHGLGKRQGLQLVEQVVQAHACALAVGLLGALVVPGGPGSAALRQHRGVGVQHGAVGLVADGAQHLTFLRRGLRQQRQGLVGMRSQHHMVEMLGALVGGHAHAGGVALDAAHGGVQALVGHAGQDFFDVVAGAAGHRPPLGAVGHLDQAVVVAEADHRCHRELQHLVRRAAPDAAQHGQEVPVAEGVAKAVFLQKVAQRLHQRLLGIGLGDAGAQLVEAQQVGQHAPETGVHQVAALGEHGREVGAAPLQCLAATRARHLHRERHV